MNIHSKSFLACLLIVVFTACASRAANHLPLPEDIPGMPTEQAVEAVGGSLVSISQTETESLRESLTKQVTDLGVKTEDLSAFGISYDGARTDFMVVPPIILDKEAQEYQNERLFIKQGEESQELTMRVSDMTTILVPVGEGSVLRPMAIWGLEGEKEEDFQPVLMYLDITEDDFREMTERQRESFEFNFFSPNKNGEGKTVIVAARGADPLEGAGKLLAKVAVEPVPLIENLSPRNDEIVQRIKDYVLPENLTDETVGAQIFRDMVEEWNQGRTLSFAKLHYLANSTHRFIAVDAFFGGLSEDSRKSPSSLLMTAEQVKKLEEQGMTIFFFAGNTDSPYYINVQSGKQGGFIPSTFFLGKHFSATEPIGLESLYTLESIDKALSYKPEFKAFTFNFICREVLILITPDNYTIEEFAKALAMPEEYGGGAEGFVFKNILSTRGSYTRIPFH